MCLPPRQDPEGAYAAVIPKWIASMIQGEPVHINGDGEASRDFCRIANVVQANLLAATVSEPPPAEQKSSPVNQVYDIAEGERTTLNELYAQLHHNLPPRYPRLRDAQPVYGDFRADDARHSVADIGKAAKRLGYLPHCAWRKDLSWAWPDMSGIYETARCGGVVMRFRVPRPRNRGLR